MEKKELLIFWKQFFSDLILGTLKRFFLFGLLGISIGILGAIGLNVFFVQDTPWANWQKMLATGIFFLLYGFSGAFHGAISSLFVVADKKLSEVLEGLHDLLDLFSKEVFAKLPRQSKTIPKEELDERFEKIGKKFLEDLKLRKTIFGFFSWIIFWVILKVLKFLFLNDVLSELHKKPTAEVTRSDIESAVRRVSVELMVSPFRDYFLLLQILNFVLMLFTLSLPYWLFWKFF